MAGSFKLHGIEAMLDSITGLTSIIVDEAQSLANDEAKAFAGKVRSEYPTGPTGNLKKGVKTRLNLGAGFMTSAEVRSTAPHAHLYEYGTVKQPARPVLAAGANSARAGYENRLINLLKSHGLTVSGA